MSISPTNVSTYGLPSRLPSGPHQLCIPALLSCEAAATTSKFQITSQPIAISSCCDIEILNSLRHALTPNEIFPLLPIKILAAHPRTAPQSHDKRALFWIVVIALAVVGALPLSSTSVRRCNFCNISLKSPITLGNNGYTTGYKQVRLIRQPKDQ